jgi:hypothetical protein
MKNNFFFHHEIFLIGIFEVGVPLELVVGSLLLKENNMGRFILVFNFQSSY